MAQTHYTDPSSDENGIMGSFLAMSDNKDANTENHKDSTKCPNKGGGGKNKSLKNATIPNPKPSSDIRTFFKKSRVSKRTRYSRNRSQCTQ